MNWYFEPFRKYADFSGRARRMEYWIFYLVNAILSTLLFYIDVAVLFSTESYFGGFSSIFSLMVFVPSLAVYVRRLHDTGKSGWYFFLILVPIIGWILILVALVTDSEPGDNQYGPNPKKTGHHEIESQYVANQVARGYSTPIGNQQPAIRKKPSRPSKPKISAWLVSSEGVNLQLNAGITTLGRTSANDIRIQDDSTISRRHARITENNGHFSILDLGSTNGTRVNGKIIRQAKSIFPDDEIQLGDNSFFRFVSSSK